jgi:tetratricopeptide (TPR) repeat protein
VREAKKLYALEPKDWITNCVLGQDALSRKDDAGVDKYLAVIGDPQGTNLPDLGGLLYALELYKQAGKDLVYLRTFTVNKVIPNLKNANLTTIAPAGRVQILACFVDTCLGVVDASVPNLIEYWSWSSRLADSTLEDATEAKNAQILSQLATLQPPMNGILARFQKLNLMGEDEAKRQMKVIDERLRKIWAAARQADPKNSAGYVGEAYALLKADDTAGAIQQILAGYRATGSWDMPLLIALTAWAKAARQADEVLPKLLAVADQVPNNVMVWQLVAEAAEAANRRDKAIEALEKAREKAPNNPWLAWSEARLLLDADRPDRALELLRTIPEKERFQTPTVIRAYTHALVGAGKDREIPEVARKAMDEGERTNDPALALAPALGLLDSPPTKDRAVLADDIADRVQVRWSKSLEALQIRARARIRAAEEDVPLWSEVRVKAALDALTQLKAKAPSDRWAPAMLAWVRYKGRDPVEKAWNELATVLPAETDPALPADVLEVIGTLYYAKGQYDNAIRVLTRAVAATRQPAGPQITLALAYLKKGDRRTGRELFEKIRYLTQSDRVREEFKAAAPLFTPE